jgi:23S rRNA pseudouridine1911/1915/1917 synthase
MNTSHEPVYATIEPEYAGQRLDQVLPKLFPEYSRSRLQEWIRGGQLKVDGEQWRPRDKVLGGERVELLARVDEQLDDQPQDIPLELLYTDEDLLVINKPAGMVVHPAAGNHDGTMLNALLHYDETLRNLPRAGIIHRLDKETSGILVVARTLNAHRSLVEQLQAREIKREYRAVVCGVLTAGGRVDQPIGRHPVNRIRMAVTASGKEAITHYRVLERFRAHSYLRVNLESGRTHQIRVHMAHIRYPLLGDPLYGGRLRIPAGTSTELREQLQNFRRQALHAKVLGLEHPTTGEWMEWEAAVPEDMQQLLAALREDAADG